MTSTPDINSRATVKLSPFGSGINKNLLTPCRRIGLSRKRKTNSAVKTLLDKEYSNSDVSFSELPISTPVCNGQSTDTPKYSTVNTTIESSTEKINRVQVQAKRSKTKVCRKKLERSFSPLGSVENNSDVKCEFDKPVIDSSQQTKDEQDSHIITVEALVHSSDCSTDLPKEILCDIGNIHIEETKGIEDEESCIKAEIRKECKVLLQNLSKQDLKQKSEDTDDEMIVRRKKIAVIDDDDDFTSSPIIREPIRGNGSRNKQASELKDSSLVKRKSSEKFTQSDSKKVKMKSDVILRKKSVNEDEDDAFTSTPERDSREKAVLIDKIKSIEIKLKEKREKLQHLQQAAVYRKKHNIEELKLLKETWRVGCVQGLWQLLAQLQTHSPMNMTDLLNKLHIDSDAVKELCIDLNC